MPGTRRAPEGYLLNDVLISHDPLVQGPPRLEPYCSLISTPSRTISSYRGGTPSPAASRELKTPREPENSVWSWNIKHKVKNKIK